ncbi:MAG: transglutaminase domain-containing protein [Lachnospiraceae bacterium]|nr:transglutaminase domain-containing protein [Lachnospiraceae bacterium]
MTALLYEIIYVCTVTCGLLSYFLPLTGAESVTVPAALITLIIACIVPVLRKSGWTVRLIIAGILIAIGVASAFLLRNDAVKEFLTGYRDYMYLPLIAAGGLIIGEALVNIKPLKVIVSVILIAFMIWAGITSYSVDKYMIFCVSSMLIITVIEVMQGGWKKSGDTDNKKHLVYVSGFAMISIILILICPAPEEPYDWNFVKNIAHAAYEMILDIGRRLTPDDVYDPADSSIGFSGRGEVLGNIAHQQDEVLELNELTNGVKAIRLAGKSFDTFDGRAWYSNDDMQTYANLTDTVAFLAAVSEYTEKPEDLARRSTFRVDYSALRSEYIFAPPKSSLDPNAIADNAAVFTGGDMMWAGDKPDKYYVSFYRLNAANPEFLDFLKNASVPSEASFNEQLAQVKGSEGYTSYESYLEYADHIRSFYLQPVELSDELCAYMDEVYEGCEDDIDKAVRLCDFLKSFQYTNTPGELPEYVTDSASLLDYFVLETRRGYCTHFATAFVLLARAEGIPARYVQGYYVPTAGKPFVTVYTSMAHAWPEIYVDGAGWIAFEPTPGYSAGTYWYTGAQASEAYANLGAGYGGYQPPEIPEVAEEADSPEEETPQTVIPWYVIVIPVVSGVLFVILFIFAGNLLVSFAYRRKEPSVRYRVLCRQVLGLLEVLDAGTMPGETLREYGERISEVAGEGIDDFIGNLTLFLYAEGKDLAAYEKQAISYKNALLKRIRKERPVKYLRYYLGFQKVKYGKTVDNA